MRSDVRSESAERLPAESRWTGKLSLVGASLLAGASGLGLEILVVTLCGLTLGYGRSGPIGISLFIAGWALGARFSGALRTDARRVLWITGGILAIGALGVPRLLLAVGASAPGGTAALLVSLFALLAVAIPQGVFLPQLARGWKLEERGDLGLLFAANLAGAAIGAIAVGHHLPAWIGRPGAAAIAGGVALLAAAIGALGIPRDAPSSRRVESPAPLDPDHLSPAHAGLILAACVGWLGTLEWVALRLGTLWLGGMQPALTGILLASMVALGVGAWLGPRVLGGSLSSVVRLLVLCTLSSLALLHLPFFLDGTATLAVPLRAMLLVGPALLPFGALVPILHRHTAGRSAERLGRLLVWEALGALVGLPLSHWLLLPALGLSGTVVFWCLAPAASILLLVPRLRLRSIWGIVAVGSLAFFGASKGTPPALDSPPLRNPALEVLEFTEDRHFAVSVVRDGLTGERTLMTDGFRAAGTGIDYRYMRVLGHLPLLLHREPRTVAVLAFGTGTTAGAVSKHPEVTSIDVLELSRAVTEYAPHFVEVNLGVLEETERVTVRLGDGRRTLAERPGTYDVLTMEPLLPDSPFGTYLYTQEFYELARRALAPGGLVCQWVPPHALEPQSFEAVVAAFTSAFEWSSLWLFGTQLILVGGEGRPVISSSRFPGDGGDLHRALDELGLGEPEGLLSRYVADGSRWPAAARPLTDGDPWIIYQPRRRGAQLLADLPLNLARLREASTPIPTDWWVGLGEAAERRFDTLSTLRRAREAFAVEEAEARGVSLPDPDLARGGERLLLETIRLAPSDPEVMALSQEREFLDTLREGVGLLLGDRSARGAEAAAVLLQRAVGLRPKRADALLYLAVALERIENPRAAEVLAVALERCPRILETLPPQRIAALGITARQPAASPAAGE